MGLQAGTSQRLLAAAFLAVAAAACGGGVGGSPAEPPGLPAPPAAAPSPEPQAVSWGVFPSAVVVIGQEDFDDGGAPVEESPTRLNFPVGSPAVSSDGTLFVAEQGATQFKAFPRYTSADGPATAFRFSVDNSPPAGASIQGQKLVVVEGDRVAIYDGVPDAAPTVAPFATVGGAQDCSASLLNRPRAAYLTPSGQLIVADTGNHRVLIWNSIENGGDLRQANVVIGQPNMETCDANAGSTSATGQTLNEPTSVWSDGVRLIVTDRRNHRVLIWANLPTTDFQEARHVIGQTDPTSNQPNAGLGAPVITSLSNPVSVDVSETGQMAVADRQNNRILVWNSIPTASGEPADQVLGQPDFVTGEPSPASVRTLNNPSGVRFDGRNLIVVDGSNNRVLVFRALD